MLRNRFEFCFVFFEFEVKMDLRSKIQSKNYKKEVWAQVSREILRFGQRTDKLFTLKRGLDQRKFKQHFIMINCPDIHDVWTYVWTSFCGIGEGELGMFAILVINDYGDQMVQSDWTGNERVSMDFQFWKYGNHT